MEKTLSAIISFFKKDKRSKLALYCFEFGIIFFWIYYLSAPFLDFNPNVWLRGGDYPHNLANWYIWENFKKCGSCFLWNGGLSGGLPAMGDIFGGNFHPVVILSVVTFGVINASKVVFIFSLVSAAVAQWWISKTLGVSFIARLWSCFFIVAAGHIWGRLDAGWIIMILSIGAGSLAFAGFFHYLKVPTVLNAIIFALLFSLFMLAGQGYLQIVFVLACGPALLGILPFTKRNIRLSYVKQIPISVILTIGLLGFYWIPLIAALPYFEKNAISDYTLTQPIAFAFASTIIPDARYYSIIAALPYLTSGFAFYYNFIGLIPYILATLSFHSKVSEMRLRLFLFLSIIFIFLHASAVTFEPIANMFPFLYGLRNLALMVPLAIPLIIGLASVGVDECLKLALGFFEFRKQSVYASIEGKLISVVGLVFVFWTLHVSVSLLLPHTLNRAPFEPTTRTMFQKAAEQIANEPMQWTAYPNNGYFYFYALQNGLKISTDKDTVGSVVKGGTRPPWKYSFSDTWQLEKPESVEYALATKGEKVTTCVAKGLGGKIDVVCPTEAAGALTLAENNFKGWNVYVSDKKTNLGSGQWLSTPIVAGAQKYSFRFEPSEPFIGVLLSATTVLGVLTYFIWSLLMLHRRKTRSKRLFYTPLIK